jgi:hypothetical protein
MYYRDLHSDIGRGDPGIHQPRDMLQWIIQNIGIVLPLRIIIEGAVLLEADVSFPQLII